MSGLNIEYLRELNKFTILKLKADKYGEPIGAPTQIYRAPFTGGFSYDLGVEYSGLFGGARELNSWEKYANIIGSMFDIPTMIDTRKRMFFSGSKEISISIPTFLVLQDSYEDDIRKPLLSLMSYVLPTRSESVSLEEYKKTYLDEIDKQRSKWNKKSENKDKSGEGSTLSGVLYGLYSDFWNLLQEGANMLNLWVGRQWLITPPEPVKAADGCLLRAKFGNKYSLDEIAINSVRVTVPEFIYEDGYPPYVKVDITISSLRMATTDLANSLI